MRSTKELAEAIEGGNVTEAVIENIESGRKVSLDVSQLLNIAMALRLPLSYLLAPIGDPNATLDLPNLSLAFADMSSIEFDAWLAGVSDGTGRARSVEERHAVDELKALRVWNVQRREVARLETMLQLEQSTVTPDVTSTGFTRSTADRLADSKAELSRLTAYLESGGWELPF